MRSEPADCAADANPLGDDLNWDDQDRTWKLVVPLQVHLIPRAEVSTVHQVLGHRNLSVRGDLSWPVWRVHKLQTTNICSIEGDRIDLPPRQTGGGKDSPESTVMYSAAGGVRHEPAGRAEQDPLELALP